MAASLDIHIFRQVRLDPLLSKVVHFLATGCTKPAEDYG